VIDREAFDGIARHLERLCHEARPLLGPSLRNKPGGVTASEARQSLPGSPQALGLRDDDGSLANLIPPQAFEIQHITDMRQEIFGPVLHIVRWSGDPLALVDQINALGYGLTLGIQTRIDSRAQAMARRAHIGNVYINRNQIGAVVGVQPFGGEGLSGTGPKAGGPHYLYRFCAEQTITVNTTAAGGNAALLAG
jgi:RHH-type proline utilization regulon transcriptional repressor/proline dehydrogenase/delta 1-pyrroline-5-carboxylate dehydrogenase